MLKAVTFDLWQTLILDTPEGLRQARADRIGGVHAALVRHGVAVDPLHVGEAYDAVGTKLEEIWLTRRDVGSRGQVRLLLESLGLDERVPREGPLVDALDDAYCHPILSALPVANEGAEEVLKVLQGRGMRLGLICNTGRTPGKMLRLVLERLALASHLHILTFSDEVGLRKPHPEIFRHTLSALGVAAAEAAHVGDDAMTDVAGARGIGMRAVHLRQATGVNQDSNGTEAIPTLHALPAVLFPPSH
jgi:putative hydrolase of the HAD superfamily